MHGIAVVGASIRNYWTRQAINNLTVFGYEGSIWPVNPKYSEVDGLPTVSSLEEIGGDLDATIIAVAAERCPAVVSSAVAKGCRDIVVISDGFAERADSSDGVSIQAELVAACSPDTRLYGPNCVGFADFQLNLCAIAEPISKKVHLGDVSVISQSGALLSSIISALIEDGCGLDWVASLGNAAQFDIARAIDFVTSRGTTKVLCIYAEGLGSGVTLSAALRRADSAGIRIVMLKPGRSMRTARIALSHTASIASDERLVDAFLEAHHVWRVESVESMARAAMLCGLVGPRALTGGVAIIGSSGGSAAVASDIAARSDLNLASFSPETRRAIKDYAAPGSFIENPLDLVGKPGSTSSVEELYEVLFGDPDVGLIVYRMNLPWPDEAPLRERQRNSIQSLTRLAEDLRTPIVFSSIAVADWTDWILEFRRAHPGVSVVRGLELTLQTVAHLFPLAPTVSSIDLNLESTNESNSAVIGEAVGRAILAPLDLPLVRGVLCTNVADAVQAFNSLRAPVVVKIDVAGAAHKAKLGAVRLDISDEASLRHAVETMQAHLLNTGYTREAISHILVEESASGTELLIGLSRSSLGSFATIGVGGGAAGSASFARTALLPLSAGSLKSMLSDVLGTSLAASVGGQAGRELVTKLLQAFQSGLLSNYETIEFNPVFVSEETVQIADVLLIPNGVTSVN